MKKIIIYIVSVLAAQGVTAQVNPELQALIRQSLNYFPRIKELEKSSEISEVRVGLARGAYQPTITGNASYNYIDPVGEAVFPTGPGETRTIQFQPHNNYNANVALNQVIFDFGKTAAQVEKAKNDLLLNQYNTEAAQLQLASQVVGIYYGLIYFRRSLEVQDSVLAFYQQNRKIVEGKIRQGDALPIDLMNIDNSIEQEQSRKTEFQRLYDRQIALLRYTSGQSTLPALNDFDFRIAASSDASALNPDVRVASQRVTSASADEKLAASNRLPSLNFVATAGFRNGYQPDIEEIRFNYLAGVTLAVPIFQGRRLTQSVVLAKKSVELYEQSKVTLVATLERDVANAQADITAYTQQVDHAHAQLTTARESLRLSRVRYERGVATYLDLVYASTNLQRAMLNEVQYQYQRCLAFAELARLSGVRFWE